jgi:hypothetical protein
MSGRNAPMQNVLPVFSWFFATAMILFSLSFLGQEKSTKIKYEVAFSLCTLRPIIIISEHSLTLVCGRVNNEISPPYLMEEYIFGKDDITIKKAVVEADKINGLDLQKAILNCITGSCVNKSIGREAYRQSFSYNGQKYVLKIKKHKNKGLQTKGLRWEITLSGHCLYESELESEMDEKENDWGNLLYNPGFYVADLDQDGNPEIIFWYMSGGSIWPLDLVVLSSHPERFKGLSDSINAENYSEPLPNETPEDTFLRNVKNHGVTVVKYEEK